MSEHTEARRGSGVPEATLQFPGRAGAGFLPSDSWASLQGLQADDGLNIVRARVGSGRAGCPHVGSGHREWRLRRGRQRAHEPGPEPWSYCWHSGVARPPRQARPCQQP